MNNSYAKSECFSNVLKENQRNEGNSVWKLFKGTTHTFFFSFSLNKCIDEKQKYLFLVLTKYNL